MKPLAFFTTILTSSLFAVPAYALAANATFFGPIVPDACNCPGQQAAGYGCALQVIQNIMNAGISFSTVIFVLVVVYGGFLFMTSVANPENRSAGIKMIMGAFIGMVIVLSSWLIVDFFMKTFYGGQFGPWNSILGTASPCIIATETTPLFTGTTTVTPGSPGGGTGTGGTGSQTGAGSGTSHLNIQAAVQYLQSNANSGPTGQCWQWVRKGLCAGGLTKFCSAGLGNAFQQGPNLTGAGFTTFYSGTYSHPASDSAAAWQAGDIVVFQPVAKHPYGHIAMYSGSQWISDYVQPNGMSSNYTDYQGGSFTVYRP